MAKAAIPAQILAIIGAASVLAGAHSLFAPIKLNREQTGFVIPAAGEGPGTSEPQESESADPEPVIDPDTEPAAGPDEPSETDGLSEGKMGLSLAVQQHERAMMGEPIWFLDARRREDFDAGHIAGALFMAHTHLGGGEGLDEIMAYSPPEANDLLVIYCTGGDCQASEDTAILLEQAGYTNIAIMASGFDEWASAGHPTEGP